MGNLPAVKESFKEFLWSKIIMSGRLLSSRLKLIPTSCLMNFTFFLRVPACKNQTNSYFAARVENSIWLIFL